jgi:hypothetical protein
MPTYSENYGDDSKPTGWAVTSYQFAALLWFTGD